ncbi:hypothetical protein Tco_0947779 [Tanacetum coccineum]
MLDARLKMLETRLEMERHPKDHPCQSAAMLHELLNDMKNLHLQLRVSSSHGPSTPQGSSLGPSTNPSFYHDLSTHQNSSPGSSGPGRTECSNCKVKDLRIKMLEARLKMLETRLEMKRNPEDHAFHELLNDMKNLRME